MATRTSPRLVVSLLTTAALAQTPTATPSPQTPTTSVAAAVPRTKALAYATQLDRLLDQGLQRAGEQPTAIVDDATFVRRAYLQICGRIPALAETETFLQDQSADKRAALVDRLFDSAGWTSNESNFWFELLRVKSRQRQLSGEPFAHWIRESVRTGKPYDEFVAEMVAASGPAHQDGHGATGYLLRDMNMPHDAMANTLRLFLGTRVECAQCHNHPFDKWTQREFYAAAAFYGGLRYRIDPDRERLQQVRSAIQNGTDQQQRAARLALQSMGLGIAGSGTGLERLPEDYKYDDAKPRDIVRADTPFGADVKLQQNTPTASPRGRRPQRPQPPTEVDSRQVFAQWLTDARNPRFARVITGRLWARTFGRGLIGPIDDLKDDTTAVFPELQQRLEKMLVELDFDLRQFERVLCLTQLFQRQASAVEPPADQPWHFAAPLVRRMTAEQLWDSLLTLQLDAVDQQLQPTDARARDVYERYRELTTGDPEQVAAMLQRGPRPDPQQVRQRLQEAMQNLSPEQQQKLRAAQRELLAARRRGDAAAVERAQRELAALGIGAAGDRGGRRGRDGELLRASDLVQPAPANHLLRQFGQSDRETIDGASLAASVPQALTLMNGPQLTADSALGRRLQQATSNDDRIRLAFLAILSREPDAAATATWREQLSQQQNQGTQDLVWVLCNSDEFRFRR